MNLRPHPAHAAHEQFDIIVIGGGVYGLMIGLEAGRAGLRAAIVERNQIGGATSANWFRILHGGLRYLQTLDIPRLRESITERRWFLRHFPDLVRPMGFLMPLYGEKMRHPAVFRAAFALDAALTLDRNAGLSPDSVLARGRVLSVSDVREICAQVRTDGLLGGALWNDAVAEDGAALVAALRSRAEASGATIIEHAEALALETDQGSVTGVTLRRPQGHEESLQAPVVVNAAGPWCAELAARFDRPIPELFRPSLAFNLVLDLPPPAPLGLAVAPPDQTDPTLFLYPVRGGTFAGTWHTSWHEGPDPVHPPQADIDAFLEALNLSVPTLGATREHIVKIHAGLLPAKETGTAKLSVREIIFDHGNEGGPLGLYTVSGVKFTTSRRVAANLVKHVLASKRIAATPDMAE
ncbi:FAD-dependent oxidoreductase [Ruegeria sp. 2205SS24-7]|uniref:FAD-dependent oxidoreductase n=1 Tax=Ruegeria discodermiae TaxID=3064389 RepID=UPI0027429B42|nr:FAD-dependent oxidoreductase [Ruegeria sp. 2205SS24-7]MDP5220867.1 FAD-dependent oxidoreductase [Ruegeria sp. 2205SS24-7]